MAKPRVLTGTTVFDDSDYVFNYLSSDYFDPYIKNMISESFRHIKLDGRKPIFMEDDNNVIYPIYMKDILEQIARRQLDRALDHLIESVKYDNLRMDQQQTLPEYNAEETTAYL